MKKFKRLLRRFFSDSGLCAFGAFCVVRHAARLCVLRRSGRNGRCLFFLCAFGLYAYGAVRSDSRAVACRKSGCGREFLWPALFER